MAAPLRFGQPLDALAFRLAAGRVPAQLWGA